MLHQFSLFYLLAIYVHTDCVAGDDRVHFDWINSNTLKATIGAELVGNETKINLTSCYFDDKDRRFVLCTPTAMQIDSDVEINPFGAGKARNLTYGIWLQSAAAEWEDKVFGIPFEPRNATSFIRITDHSFLHSNYSMKIQPISYDFPQMVMTFFLACQNGSTYIGDEMDLTEFVASETAAVYQAQVHDGMSSICHQACAQLYIRGTEKGTTKRHKFRVGAVCSALQNKNLAIAIAVLKIRLALSDMLDTILPQLSEDSDFQMNDSSF